MIKIIFTVIASFGLFSITAEAATIKITPTTGSYTDSFTMTVYVDSQGDAVNAYVGTITIPTERLRVDSISVENSIVDFWVTDPSKKSSATTVRFEGTTFFPGYTGSRGQLFSMQVTPVQQAVIDIRIEGMEVLAADGAGTDLSTTPGTARYQFQPEKTKKNESDVTEVAIQLPARPEVSIPVPTITAVGTTSDTITVIGTTSPAVQSVVLEYWPREYLSQCEVTIHTILQKDDVGEQVSALQLYLAWRLQLSLTETVTGYYGTKTATAVTQLQREAKITEDSSGMVGQATRIYINNDLCQKQQTITTTVTPEGGTFEGVFSAVAPGEYSVSGYGVDATGSRSASSANYLVTILAPVVTAVSAHGAEKNSAWVWWLYILAFVGGGYCLGRGVACSNCVKKHPNNKRISV